MRLFETENQKQYREKYLTSEHWLVVRQARLEYDSKRCRSCGGNKILQVHHLSYKNRGDEKISDLITLCKLCHLELHRGIRDLVIILRNDQNWRIREQKRTNNIKKFAKKNKIDKRLRKSKCRTCHADIAYKNTFCKPCARTMKLNRKNRVDTNQWINNIPLQ